ncbi:unnamed protein product [Meloidogyne enterolobii]|uniref:Uncharacterized protein n=1 Tax=Meloidogyne enterolobii TaxID=390850 RepID=A0ACB0ZKP2_MELEN
MPSKDFINRRKRRQRHSVEGQFGSNATNSCGVEGVSDDGRLLNVNPTGVTSGDGTLDRGSVVDGIGFHSESVLIEGSLVDGSFVESSLVDGFSGENC